MRGLTYKLLRYSGFAWLWRETIQRNKVTFLLFHDMDVIDAERNFTYLKKHYRIIGLSDYLKAVRLGAKLPKKSVVITFDDGHVSNYQMLPAIQRLQIPVTIFLCSSIVGTRRHFWFRHSEEMKSQVEALKQLTNQQRLETLRQFGFEQQKEYDDTQALSKEQIAEMKVVVDFQSHTCYHPILPQCDNEEARWEIVDSKQQLESDFGLEISALSYPNGDYSLRDIKIAKDAGYSCGVTVDSGYNDSHTDLFRIKRFSVNDAKTITELMVKASGCYALMKHKFHKPAYGFKTVGV
jgi:peptidoglycan/xylan/chitin deacetylase (PgdA/CDA1 family)